MKKVLLVCVLFGLAVGLARPVSAISEAQRKAIVDNCATIQEDLRTLQHDDSRTRVYLGKYYEATLTKFIVPLNLRLAENNLMDDDLVINQTDFAKTRTTFIVDYIEYQKKLEELVGVDCRKEPDRFYRKLNDARVKRQVVAEDSAKMQKLMLLQVSLVEGLKEKI